MSENAYRDQLIVPGDRIISAFDSMSWDEAAAQAAEIGQHIGMAKTNSLHQRKGIDHAVGLFIQNGLYTMVDQKYHDIPETVAESVKQATLARAALITVHASGGAKMLAKAVEGRNAGLADYDPTAQLGHFGGLLGITVLTSLGSEECESVFGIPMDDEDGIKKKVVQFADMALDAGLDGIVCSPLEVESIRSHSKFDRFLVVTPGITPDFAVKAGDQTRTASPRDAINAGADMIVIGRGINKAESYGMTKAVAAMAIGEEICATLRK